MKQNNNLDIYTKSLIEDLKEQNILRKQELNFTKLLNQILKSQQSGNLAVEWDDLLESEISWKDISSLNVPFLVFKEISGIKYVYLQKTYTLKEQLEEKIKSIISLRWKNPIIDLSKINESIVRLEKLMIKKFPSFILNHEQKKAIQSCVINPFHIISGGPGTGKTTIVAFIIKVLEEIGELPESDQIALAAPTGRAAQRLTESIQKSIQILNDESHSNNLLNHQTQLNELRGKTIHNLLVTKPYLNGFYYGKERYLPQRLIFIDETSMVDLNLMLSILHALPPEDINYRLVLIGDPNQLPSVEKGAVINDLIDTLNKDSKLVTHLTKSNRQKIQENGQKSKIQSVAEDIINLKFANTHSEELKDKSPTLFNQFNPIPDSIRLESFQKTKSLVQNKENHEQIVRLQIDTSKIINFRDGMLKKLWNEIFLKQIEEITKWNLKNLNDLNSLELFNKFQSIITHFRCLTIYKKGYFGVHGLNQGIETLAKNELYPRQGSKTNFYWSIQRKSLSSKLYYTGLPILILENDTSRKLFNGDIGLIIPIGDKENSELRAIFTIDNQLNSFAIDTLPKHEDAYFLSVHKSQGSEYDELLIYLPPISKSVHSDEEASLMNRQILYTAITRARNKVYLACDEESWNSSLQNNLSRITGFKL